MHIGKAKAPLVFLLAHFLTAGGAQAAFRNCHLVTPSDSVYGSLLSDVRSKVPERDGLAICVLGPMNKEFMWPMVMAPIKVVNGVRTYEMDSLYNFRTRFRGNSQVLAFFKDIPDTPTSAQEIDEDTKSTAICLTANSCENFLDDGFAAVGDTVKESQYPELVSLWSTTDFSSEILKYHGSNSKDLGDLKEYIASGGRILPIGVQVNTSSELRWHVSFDVYGANASWALELEVKNGFGIIVDVWRYGGE